MYAPNSPQAGMGLVFVFVVIWFIANTIATIASKTAMLEVKPGDSIHSLTDWTPAFQDLRWVDLTMLQHIVAALAGVIWMTTIQCKSVFNIQVNKKHMLIAAAGNALGNLATNASFAAVSSSTTQVIKSSEPIFTFMLTLILYRKDKDLGPPLFVSVIVMVTGACFFISGQALFNVWGLGAAAISNIAFPLRNIYLKKGETSLEEPCQKFMVISVYSVLLLLPWVIAKFVLHTLPSLRPEESIISAAFHFTYNAASITVLQSYSPVVHSLLNLSKRVFVIVANIVYFSTPVSFKMAIGLVVFFVGLVIFKLRGNEQMQHVTMQRKSQFIRILFMIVIILAIGLGANLTLTHRQTLNTGSVMKASSKLHTHNMMQQVPLPKIKLTTSWVYDNPIPDEVVQNIADIIVRNPTLIMDVYCGTSQCMQALANLNKINIRVKFLVASDFMKDTALGEWLARHPIHKIMTGVNFEDYFQEAVRLALLWHHGGIYFDPLMVLGEFTPPTHNEAWLSVGEHTNNTDRGLLDVSRFPRQHSFIEKLMTAFVRRFPHKLISANVRASKTPWLIFDFPAIVRNTYSDLCQFGNPCPTVVPLRARKLPLGVVKRNRYGTLTFDRLIRTLSHAANLGDEMQGFPGIQFLPFVDHYLERDELRESKFNHVDQILVFLNAWWGLESTHWPPPKNVNPIMLSMHFERPIQSKIERYSDYLRSKAPIGCRDTETLAFLQKINVESFFSGCLTVLIKNPNSGKKRSDEIYMVDVKSDYVSFIPEDIQKRAINVNQLVGNRTIDDRLARFQMSYNLLEMYSRAKLVITQRLHCAMPCVALGTPVIFINSATMPGGGGSAKTGTSRVAGLTSLFHSVDMYKMSEEEAKEWLHGFDWQNPPPNPGMDMLMRMRATFWNIIRQKPTFYDNARKFGMLPLSPPAINTPDQLLFHMILLTSGNTPVKELNWSEMRAVESILRQHPLATIIIHSNTILQSQFNVLTESGYTVQVRDFDIADILKDVALTTSRILKKHDSLFNDKDLLKMLVLYRWGGVYVDTDALLVKQIDHLKENYLIWSDETKTMLDLSFLKFKKGHHFVESSLEVLAKRQSEEKSGAKALTDLWLKWPSNSTRNNVRVLDRGTSYVLFDKANYKDCIESTTGSVFDSHMEKINSKVFFARISIGTKNFSGKLKDGTVCKHLYNSFCVLCNEMY